MTGMEKAYNDLAELTERVRAITYSTFLHNPAVECEDKKPLIDIGVEAKSIGDAFNSLGVHILNIQEDE